MSVSLILFCAVFNQFVRSRNDDTSLKTLNLTNCLEAVTQKRCVLSKKDAREVIIRHFCKA